MHKQDHKYCYQLQTNQLDNAEMNKCLDMYNQPKPNQTEINTLNRPKMRRKIPLICVHPRESPFVLHFWKIISHTTVLGWQHFPSVLNNPFFLPGSLPVCLSHSSGGQDALIEIFFQNIFRARLFLIEHSSSSRELTGPDLICSVTPRTKGRVCSSMFYVLCSSLLDLLDS